MTGSGSARAVAHRAAFAARPPLLRACRAHALAWRCGRQEGVTWRGCAAGRAGAADLDVVLRRHRRTMPSAGVSARGGRCVRVPFARARRTTGRSMSRLTSADQSQRLSVPPKAPGLCCCCCVRRRRLGSETDAEPKRSAQDATTPGARPRGLAVLRCAVQRGRGVGGAARGCSWRERPRRWQHRRVDPSPLPSRRPRPLARDRWPGPQQL